MTSRNKERIHGRSAWDFSVPFLGHTDRPPSRYPSPDIRTTCSTLTLRFFPEDEGNISSETLVTTRQITRHRIEEILIFLPPPPPSVPSPLSPSWVPWVTLWCLCHETSFRYISAPVHAMYSNGSFTETVSEPLSREAPSGSRQGPRNFISLFKGTIH